MESRVLKEFVANRVATIQEKTEGCQWHHVSGQYNPSRGVDLRELLKPDNIWFSGHSFLRSVEYTESALEPEEKLIEAEKKKVTRHCHVQSSV